MSPIDLPKAPKGAVAVLISHETWNQLRGILIAGWPVSGQGIAIDGQTTGRMIRLLVAPTIVDAPTGGTGGRPAGFGSGSPPSHDSGSPDRSSPDSSSPDSSSPDSSSPDSSSPDSSSSDSSSSESSKAIVWANGSWRKLHCVERRTVDFVTVATVLLRRNKGSVTLPPEFMESVEPGSIEIASIVVDRPALATVAKRPGGKISVAVVNVGSVPAQKATITVRAQRKGFPNTPGWKTAQKPERVQNGDIWATLSQAATV